jgi:hypothetical protein
VAPETLIVDHGKIYLLAHLTSVCRRMRISVQPARQRTGRDKPRASYCASLVVRISCGRHSQ